MAESSLGIKELHAPEKQRNIINERTETYKNWLRILDDQEANRRITPEQRLGIIARTLVTKDLIIMGEEEEKKRDVLLTSLFNKAEFNQILSNLIQEEVQFGLLAIDVDSFKKINDTYGHPVGDIVLTQLGSMLTLGVRQMRENMSEDDIVGRVGGDELAIIVMGVSKPSDLKKVAEHLRNFVERSRLSVESLSYGIPRTPLTLSIGGCVWSGQDPKLLRKKADRALYTAKNQGRNRSVILES